MRSLSWAYKPVPEAQYYWGKVTSTINWCEEDYVVTRFIAEFCNTTTNSVFVLLATIAIINSLRYGYEKRILVIGAGYLLVGIGSWLFHMTLKYEFQLLDELPMIYTTLLMFWAIFDYQLSVRQRAILTLFTIGVGVGVTWYYLVNQNPVFHEVAFGLITVAGLIRSWSLAHTKVTDPTAKADLKYSAILGATTFLSGFALWGVDQVQCSNITVTKHWMGLPWGFVFELHGWWHILTGIGTAMFITFLTQLRLHLTDRQDEFEMRYYYAWPYLVRSHPYKLVNDHEA